MNNWEKWMQFACRMIGILDRTQQRKTKLLKTVIDFISQYRDTELVGWDDEHEEYGYLSDYIDECFEDGWKVTKGGDIIQTKFFIDVCCAVRAGIDVVIPEQWHAGVVGFTAGDIRKMYPEGIPGWLQETFDKEYKESFSAAKDEDLIWL